MQLVCYALELLDRSHCPRSNAFMLSFASFQMSETDIKYDASDNTIKLTVIKLSEERDYSIEDCKNQIKRYIMRIA